MDIDKQTLIDILETLVAKSEGRYNDHRKHGGMSWENAQKKAHEQLEALKLDVETAKVSADEFFNSLRVSR